ncbi:MAG: ABC-F family ATP-binding cassette domain-containing protein [Ilumatobacteraceae bacterium]
MILLDAQQLAASRPNRPLFADISLTVSDGDRIGVVGLNGCGKSTLLRMLAGELQPESGEVRRGRGTRLGFLAQRPVLPAGSVRDAAAGHHGVGQGATTADGGDGVEIWRAEAMLDRLGMAALADVPTTELSGGQAKRVALAALLCGEFETLILDEPTNHLDLDAIQFLETWLAAFRGGLVLVTHDRHVLDRVATKVLEIDRGSGYLHVPEGRSGGSGYAAYLAGRAERDERAEVAEQARRNLASRELAWLRRGAPARSTKPKARIATATAVVNGRPQAAARSGALGLEASLGSGAKRLGSKGIELQQVAFAWPAPRSGVPHLGETRSVAGGAEVIAPVSLMFEPGDRIGIVGPNGAGKSTLLDIIAERLQPTAGVVERGATVSVGYYDQLGRGLDPAKRVRDVVAGDKGEPSLADVILMKRFWFDGDAQFAPLGTLSGGERRRLQLLLTLIEQPNVLLLDEPTNDLDLDTLRALEDFLDDWPGIVVAVSHDRSFLDRVTDELLALDGRGGIRWVRGGVAAWLTERAVAAAGPKHAAPNDAGSKLANSKLANSKPTSSKPASSKPASSKVASSKVASSNGGRAAGSSRSTAAPSSTGQAPSTRSPSTIRRQLGQAERALAAAVATRDAAGAAMASAAVADGSDHVRITALGDALAVAQAAVDVMEEQWLSLAGEAEGHGLDV